MFGNEKKRVEIIFWNIIIKQLIMKRIYCLMMTLILAVSVMAQTKVTGTVYEEQKFFDICNILSAL